jgi:alkanesulfonate monooxygenase SsuD/methylene tetrahydromethanopterin reductase-like flavin-dependent oxidoreductase (luciferase family)
MVPPPVQQPIPMWLGYQGPQGAQRAGRLGVGLLTLQRALLEPYQHALREGGWPETAARMGGVIDIIVADDPPAAFDRILPYYAYQLNTYRRYGVEGTGRPPPREITVDKIREDASARGVLPGLRVLTADDAISALREETKDLPISYLYSWASVAGMPDDLVQRHVELLGTKVAPALAG